jgi:hypothetical protein
VKPEWLEKWKARGIAFFKGQPFLTGIGVEPMMAEIIEKLNNLEIKKP